ncbi:MAG: acyl-CoA dehydrogenase [Acidiferrobacteraceae bacterium]|nr:acyl-CoA dehydrogenase [Acidiferrobacteraceae bacterium]
MHFSYTPKVDVLRQRVQTFLDTYIIPKLADWQRETANGVYPISLIEEIKIKARAEGLWNLFLPSLKHDEPGTRLTNLEYAPLAEIMGRVSWASEVFNCNAPDTGNMELLHLFANDEQNSQWLQPLLKGEIRSAFAMTEPGVSSSDATQIQTKIVRDGNDYIINGRKWFISNVAHPRCKLLIVMGKTNPDAEPHHQQSILLVPMNTPGIDVIRNIPIVNHTSPEGHCELLLRDVRIPSSCLLGTEGDGFALAQARLGPGRVHHCMRSIGAAELALELMTMRVQERKTFGKYLYEHGTISEWIARSRIEIEQARLLVLKTAWLIDQVGAKGARKEISMIKALVPNLHTTIFDRAMQVFGAMGITPDTPLADHWTWGRAMRFFDGPDEIHLRVVARMELRDNKEALDRSARYLTPYTN